MFYKYNFILRSSEWNGLIVSIIGIHFIINLIKIAIYISVAIIRFLKMVMEEVGLWFLFIV